MAFGIKREEVMEWKRRVEGEQIAFLTHYWYDPRFPNFNTVTKVGCRDINKLVHWGNQYGLNPEWIDYHAGYPHYDLLGEKQYKILKAEGYTEHIRRFMLKA